MKYLLMLIIFVAGSTAVNAQTSGGTNAPSRSKIPPPKKATARQLRGSGQYYGSKDTTPGSPMGTGGAGGDMSGSPAGSAIETDDQISSAQVQRDTVASGQTAISRKTTMRKTKTIRRKTKSTL